MLVRGVWCHPSSQESDPGAHTGHICGKMSHLKSGIDLCQAPDSRITSICSQLASQCQTRCKFTRSTDPRAANIAPLAPTIIKNATNNVPLHHGRRPTDTELLLQALVGTWHNLHKKWGGRAPVNPVIDAHAVRLQCALNILPVSGLWSCQISTSSALFRQPASAVTVKVCIQFWRRQNARNSNERKSHAVTAKSQTSVSL